MAPRHRVARFRWASATLSALPSTAWASNYGCPAEWLDIAVLFFSPPLALLALGVVACGWRPLRVAQLSIGAAILVSLMVAASTCDRGDDPDGWAVAMLATCMAVVVGAAGLRIAGDPNA